MTTAKTYDEAAYARAKAVAALVISKQHDYGVGNILNCPVGAELGIAVRLSDKLARLVNLVNSGKTAQNEGLADTAADIMGYGLVLSMLLNDEFILPLEDKA